jgi:hypothetical protein
MFDEQYCSHVIERKMKRPRRRERRCRKLPDDLTEKSDGTGIRKRKH